MSTLEMTRTSTLPALRRHAANLITGGRVLLLFLAAAFSVTGNLTLTALAVPLAVAVLLMDWLDGLAARRYRCESKVGGLLDIVGDRLAENVWWVVFAWLRLIPLWVPVVVLSRGFLTDALRSYALSKGHTAFGKETMMQSRIGHALVASRASRAAYGVSKSIAFTGLFTLNVAARASMDLLIGTLEPVALSATYLTVALCVIRGIPVVTEFGRMLKTESLP
jgi:CDP-diacylglycerol--glycerol-3-phosphate 3-phosphatidyltransferase